MAFVRDGRTLLPMEPGTRRLLKVGKYQCGDYNGLVASPLLEVGLFPPTDIRANWQHGSAHRFAGVVWLAIRKR
jgi:hypothetical protein